MDRWAAKEAAGAKVPHTASDTIPETLPETAEDRIRQFRERQAARSAEPFVPLTWGSEKKIGIHLGDMAVRVAVIDSSVSSSSCELVGTFPYSVLGWQLAGRGQVNMPTPRLCHLTRMLGGMQSGASSLLLDMYADVLRHVKQLLEARYGRTSAKLTSVVTSSVASEVEAAAKPTADYLYAAGASTIAVTRWMCESAAAVAMLGLAPRREAGVCLALVFHLRQPMRAITDVQALQVSLLHVDGNSTTVRASVTRSTEEPPIDATDDAGRVTSHAVLIEKMVATLRQLASKVLDEACASLDTVAELVLLGYEDDTGQDKNGQGPPAAQAAASGEGSAQDEGIEGTTAAVGAMGMGRAVGWSAQVRDRLGELYCRPISGSVAPGVPSLEAIVVFGAAAAALEASASAAPALAVGEE